MSLPVRRILVIRLGDLGDALVTCPAIAALRRAYPAARIDALTMPNGAVAFALCPHLDRVMTLAANWRAGTGMRGLVGGAGPLLRLVARLRLGRYEVVLLLQHFTAGFGTGQYRALLAAVGAPVRAGLDNGSGNFLTHRASDYGFGARPEWQYALDVGAALGVPADLPSPPWITVPPPAQAAARRALAGAGVTGGYVVVHAGVGGYSPARAWPLPRFVEVAARLRMATRLPVVAVGSPDEAEAGRALAQAGAVNLVGRTSFAEVAALVERARLVVGADSGIAHLAGVLGRPVAAIFGPSNSSAWGPIGSAEHRVSARPFPEADAVVVRAGIPCSPCFYVGYGLGRREGCSRRTCLDLVTADEVTDLALHLLGRGSAGAAAFDGPPGLP